METSVLFVVAVAFWWVFALGLFFVFFKTIIFACFLIYRAGIIWSFSSTYFVFGGWRDLAFLMRLGFIAKRRNFTLQEMVFMLTQFDKNHLEKIAKSQKLPRPKNRTKTTA